MPEETAEDFLNKSLNQDKGEPQSAEDFLNRATEKKSSQETAESFIDKALSTGLKFLEPIPQAKELLMEAAGAIEDSSAFSIKRPESTSPVQAAVEAARAVINMASAPVEPLTRPGGPFQPTKVAEAIAPSPLDVALTALPGASFLAGKMLRPTGKASVLAAESAVKTVEAPVSATARLEAAATKVQKQADILIEKDPIKRLILPEPVPQSPLPKMAVNINLEKINTTADVKQFISDIAASNRVVIDEAKRGVITNKQTLQLANDLGLKAEDVLKRLPGDISNAEGITAARQVLAQSAERTLEIIQATAQGRRSVMDAADALRQHILIQSKTGGLVSEVGRALQSSNIVVGGNKEKAIKAFMNALGGKEITEEIIGRLAKLYPLNPREFNIALRGIAEGTTREKIFEGWISGLLSNPKTHEFNVLSNTLAAGLGPIEKGLAGGIDFLRASITGSPKERFIGEAAKDISGIAHGIPEGFLKALRTFKDEISEFSEHATKIDSKPRQALGGAVGKAIRTPLRLLAAADEFFKIINFSGSKSAFAYQDAAKAGLKGEARLLGMAENLAHPSKNLLSRASHEAEYRTFTKKGGPATDAMMRLRRTIPGLEFIVPFITTPVNIAKFGIERTPLNLLIRTPFRIGKGAIAGGEISDELAKGTIGMLAAGYAAQQYGQGNLTGGGPKNPGQRNVLFTSGWRPYSVKVGNKYVSYARLEPMAMTMGLTADVMEMSGMLDKSDMVSKLGLAFAQNIVNKTFTRGLSDMLNAISRPELYGEGWVKSISSTAIPMTGAMGAITGVIDPTMRRPQSIPDALKARIPGLSQDVIALRDIWGKPVIIEGGPIRRGLASNIMHSIPDDFSTNEMARLKISIPHVSSKIVGVEITDKELDRYAEVSGAFAKQFIDEATGSPGWSEIPDWKKEELIMDRYGKARDIARKELFGDFKEKQKKFRVRQ